MLFFKLVKIKFIYELVNYLPYNEIPSPKALKYVLILQAPFCKYVFRVFSIVSPFKLLFQCLSASFIAVKICPIRDSFLDPQGICKVR